MQTPVQKWQIGDIISADLDKPKHILIEVGGTVATSLHFHTGNKDTAEEILAKLESSRSLARESVESATALGAEAEPAPASAPVQRMLPPPLRTDGAHSPSKKGVHFSELSPAIIPPRPPSPPEQEDQAQHEEAEGLEAYALYDFQAQGDDELTVAEGDALWIIEQDGDEWWKCRNVKGEEGVVPASYIEVTSRRSSLTNEDLRTTGVDRLPPRVVEPEAEEDDGEAEREAEERAATAKQQAREARERKDKEDREQRVKAAAIAAEADGKRKEKREREEREREREERERREKERAEEQAEEEDRRIAAEKKSAKAKAARSPKSTSDSRKSIEKRASLLFFFAWFHSHTFNQVLPLIQARRASGAIAQGSSALWLLSSVTRMVCFACTR
jgi:actin cytoskeleton-regulatory complex protein SLA1